MWTSMDTRQSGRGHHPWSRQDECHWGNGFDGPYVVRESFLRTPYVLRHRPQPTTTESKKRTFYV